MWNPRLYCKLSCPLQMNECVWKEKNIYWTNLECKVASKTDWSSNIHFKKSNISSMTVYISLKFTFIYESNHENKLSIFQKTIVLISEDVLQTTSIFRCVVKCYINSLHKLFCCFKNSFDWILPSKMIKTIKIYT